MNCFISQGQKGDFTACSCQLDSALIQSVAKINIRKAGGRINTNISGPYGPTGWFYPQIPSITTSFQGAAPVSAVGSPAPEHQDIVIPIEAVETPVDRAAPVQCDDQSTCQEIFPSVIEPAIEQKLLNEVLLQLDELDVQFRQHQRTWEDFYQQIVDLDADHTCCMVLANSKTVRDICADQLALVEKTLWLRCLEEIHQYSIQWHQELSQRIDDQSQFIKDHNDVHSELVQRLDNIGELSNHAAAFITAQEAEQQARVEKLFIKF